MKMEEVKASSRVPEYMYWGMQCVRLLLGRAVGLVDTLNVVPDDVQRVSATSGCTCLF